MLTKRFFRKFSVVSGIIGSFYGEKARFSKMLRNRYNKKDIFDIPIWEGDREIFRKLFGSGTDAMFEIKLVYHKDELVQVQTY